MIRVELPPLEEDREESRERQLGLIEPERAPRSEVDYPEEPEADAELAEEEGA